MTINQFFTDTLGVQLKNSRWSWGAIDPLHHRVFLRVWEDGFRTINGVDCVLVGFGVQGRNSNGFAERHQQLQLIRDGAKGYGVVCVAVDSETDAARQIKSFDDQTLIEFGSLLTIDGEVYATVVARVPISELAHAKSSASTLADDLRAIARLKIETTTKTALVNARVGQGLFRKQVLAKWGNACAVTGSTVLDAIRASHIMPWRDSNNEERLDSENGLPLVASLDALFDAGLISFDHIGAILISSRLNTKEQLLFNLLGQHLRQQPSPETREYLAYHRENVFYH